MITTLVVPGLDGSAAPHWQHWWAATEPTAVMVDLPTPGRPVREAWEAELAGMILRHPDSLLVGHSLGSVLIAGLLAKWPQLRVRAALLVAPAETIGAARISRFGPISEAALPVPAKIVFSRNDPWMRPERSVDLARAWQADTVDMDLAGHINVASGHGPWPIGKRLAKELNEIALQNRQKKPDPWAHEPLVAAAPRWRPPAWLRPKPASAPLFG